ncbi:hypothetical protein MASR2M78_10510 [Treponema sp.]
MKRIALIHTVRSVLDSFEGLLRSALSEQVLIHNLLDDFLATDPALRGLFTDTNKERLAGDLRNAELTGADLIVVTCSTLTPAVAELRRSMRYLAGHRRCPVPEGPDPRSSHPRYGDRPQHFGTHYSQDSSGSRRCGISN